MADLGIGLIGCGNIAATYLRNAPLFRGVTLRACADLDAAAAQARAAEFGIHALPVEQLLASPEIDLVLNLTVPGAHFDVTMAALDAGKHVFTEKPLATNAADGRRLVTAAASRRRALGSAPDTFLGAAGRLARRLVDDGAIGTPVCGTAFMMTRGMEHWHPDPAFYYQPGGGPVFDMGPYYLTMLVNLLGPVWRVAALATTGSPERRITAPGPRTGTSFAVNTPTTVMAIVEFACGVPVTFAMSWDVFRHGNHPIELHGTTGSLRLPDPDTFGGTVALSERGGEWRGMATDDALHGRNNWPPAAPDRANYRMLGVAELARALEVGARPRACGELALHVLEVMAAILQAAGSGAATEIAPLVATEGVRPAAFTEAEAAELTV